MASDNLVARLRAVDHMSVEDCFLQSPLFEEAAARIAALEAELAEARAARNNSRANSVSRGKKLLRLRAKLIQINDNIEHEGDRAYFGSTNDADELREIFLWLDGFKWDRVTSESDEDDLLSAVERLLARATAAEARAEKMAEALRDTINLAEAQNACLIAWNGINPGANYRSVMARARAALGGDHG